VRRPEHQRVQSALLLLREWQAKGASVNLCLIGTKGLAFFRRLGLPILGSVPALATGRTSRI
jgi:F0F1-type ATP synthase gamma subunit